MSETIKTFDINKFVADANDPREYLRSPFAIGDTVNACNGHVLIRFFDRAAFGDLPELKPDTAEKMNKILQDSEALQWITLDLPPVPEESPCRECKGSGKLSWKICRECDGAGELELDSAYNIYDVECKTCDGDGREATSGEGAACRCCSGTGKYWPGHVYVEIAGITIQPKYAALFEGVPSVEVASGKDMLHFRQTDAGKTVARGAITIYRVSQ